MSYEALYRKYRPKVFEDILSQDYTVTILKNQIKNSNIAHAYLFTGTRGTGKTTTARIFARAVNCLNPEDSNPCNQCEMCQGILTESMVNVVEIDAASNRGIENIRELREYANFNPPKGKYKIYIMDEAHMLTREAANAFLKILEEPPAHVIFILATTEPEKLPPTILSRCQRFDFRPVKMQDLIKQLSLICKDASIDYEEEAIRLIAYNSEGAVRDAISILDRCLSFNEETLKYEDVVDLLGVVNYETLFDLIQSIAKQSTSDALTIVNEIFSKGKDASQLMKDLILHFRMLLFAKMNVRLDEILTLPEERLKQLEDQSNLFNINQISSFIYTLSDMEAKLKYTSQPRVLMEIAVVSLCSKELSDSLDGIIERVKQLEKALASGEISVKKPIQNHRQEVTEERPQKNLPDQPIIKTDEDKNIEEANKQKEESVTSGEGIKTIKDVWQQVLNQMRKDKKAQIEAFLKEGTLEKLEGNTLIISLKSGFEFHRDRLNKDEVKDYISGVITRFTSKNLNLSFVMEDELAPLDGTNKEEDPLEKMKKTLPGEIYDIIEIVED